MTSNYGQHSPKNNIERLNIALREANIPSILAILRELSDEYGNMSDLARKADISRMALYSITKRSSTPRFESVFKLIKALGLELRV